MKAKWLFPTLMAGCAALILASLWSVEWRKQAPPDRPPVYEPLPAIRPDRPMLACWIDKCQIVIVDGVEDERLDQVMVRWPAEDGDGHSWYHGPISRDRLRPLEK